MNYGNNIEPQLPAEIQLLKLVDKWGDLSIKLFFIGHFGKIPSLLTYGEVDLKKFHNEFPRQFQQKILGYHFEKYSAKDDWKNEFIYVLRDEIVLHKTSDEVILYFHNEHCGLLKEIVLFTQELEKKEENKAQINLIISQPHGLDNKKVDFLKPQLNLLHSYNDDFNLYHQKVLEILQEENRSGLHLLYGKPGTGKSTYIRYICGLVKKKIVFLPGQMAQNLDNTLMTRYLMKNPDSILVIEDAEELVVSRDQKRNSNLAMILNITDGILGESLGIQIIATFNTDVQNIDPALKRKGRLKSAYEFKALSPEKANFLLREQNTNYSTDEEMTLAEIYNISEEEQYKSPVRKAVGFR